MRISPTLSATHEEILAGHGGLGCQGWGRFCQIRLLLDLVLVDSSPLPQTVAIPHLRLSTASPLLPLLSFSPIQPLILSTVLTLQTWLENFAFQVVGR